LLGGLVYIVGAGTVGREFLRFDPASAVWSTLAPTSFRRRFGASFVVGGSLHAVGGRDSSSSVERYDVSNNTWVAMALANTLENRSSFGAVIIKSVGPAEEQDLFDSLVVDLKATRRLG
jgi:hypothetical protein